jgi:hypothetical protein
MEVWLFLGINRKAEQAVHPKTYSDHLFENDVHIFHQFQLDL